MVLVQNWPFFLFFFFRRYRPGKCLLERDFCKGERRDFCKGVNRCFGQKMAIFPSFVFLGNIGQETVFYDILERKNAFLGYKNKKFKKSKNWHFSKGVNPWFWSKNGHFSNFFFWQYRPAKCLLRYFWTKKRLSRLYKQEVQKVEKSSFFQRS